MRLLKLNIFLFALFTLTLQVNGQRNAIEFDRLNVEHGLSQNTVYSILQDHKGYIWFGTDDGLNRFDGYTFKVYTNRIGEEGTLSNNRVIALLEDKSNRLWIATIGGGLNRYEWDTDSFVTYRANPLEDNSLSNDRVMALCEDLSGKIWIGTADGGLNLFDPQNNTFKVYINTPSNPNILPSNVIRSLFIDSQNNLWVGTDNGIALYNRDTDSFVDFNIVSSKGQKFDVKIVRRFQEDKNGMIWIASEEEGLIKYNPILREFTFFRNSTNNPNSIPSNTVHDIYEDKEGNIWVATYGGLSKLINGNNEFVNYLHNPLDQKSIGSNFIRYIYEDSMGVLWVGTYNNGLSRFLIDGKKFTVYRSIPGVKDGLPSSTINAMVEDNNGYVWIGTLGAGLVGFNTDTELFNRFDQNSFIGDKLPSSIINKIVKNDQGILWIGTNDGLARFNPQNFSLKTFKHNPNDAKTLPDRRIRNVYVDRNNDVWVATLNFGLSKLEADGNSFKTYKYEAGNPSTISQNRVISMYEDSFSNFWIGTSSEGLNLFDRQSEIVTDLFVHDLNNPNSIISNRILCFFQDSKEGLWIGTGEGLSKYNYDSKTFENFTAKDGLPNNVIYSILEDNDGRIWVSTNFGLSCLTYYNVEEPSFKNYDKFDGFPTNEFAEGSACKLESGKLMFGGVNNFVVFDPQGIKDNKVLPRVYISEAKIEKQENGKPNLDEVTFNLFERDSLVLSRNQNNITFQITILHYVAPQKNRFKYKLEGFDNKWIEPSISQRTAKYTNLKPGSYTFKVIAQNPDGYWNDQGDSFSFTIKSPFWIKWWFFVLLSFIFSLLVFGIIKIRESNLLKSKQVLEEMVTERTREISSQSEELRVQSERLQIANEEIRAKSEALEQQNRELQSKNEEITIQRNELEEQKNSLANLAWELQDKNEEITAQRNEIERQKKEITDSIMYAKRIQNAVLPSQDQIKDLFSEFFILNRPKSIVSGDFYWATRIGKHRVIAVVDCTGHGVPGGFMSMLGVLMLNEVISLRLFVDPARALNQLRQNIISVLHQSGEIDDAADGMDLSLCVIDDDDLTLTYSGANSSMLIFNPEKGNLDAIRELRSDRMPIGYHLIMKSFTSQKVKLSKGDVLYLYSDGLVDQFGGPSNKKFQHTKLKDFIVQHKDLPIETQGIVLEQSFESWKGNSFQVDDVLVMGLKV